VFTVASVCNSHQAGQLIRLSEQLAVTHHASRVGQVSSHRGDYVLPGNAKCLFARLRAAESRSGRKPEKRRLISAAEGPQVLDFADACNQSHRSG
jgi:hypothetical protein